MGFYDATITAVDPFPDREMHEAPDPTLAGIGRIFESGINQLLRSQIGIESDRRYETLNMDAGLGWKRDDLKTVLDGPIGSLDDLRFAMSLNPHMKVLITHGYYDLVTPYFSSERLVDQMKLQPQQREKLRSSNTSAAGICFTLGMSRASAFRGLGETGL